MLNVTTTTIHCEQLACRGGLCYINRFDAGIVRQRCGKGFRYLLPSGRPARSPAILGRIEQLVIPPAWNEVWICARADGHIQAVGRDEQGRKQYIYHPRWHEISSSTKFERMQVMPRVLPRIRAQVREHLSGSQLTKERVIAAVVRTIDKAHIRVGNEQYVKERDTRGATTLTADHVHVDHFTVSLDFPSKSGKRAEVEFTDRKVAKVIRQCEELSGQYLFSYLDAQGSLCQVTSSDVNKYLRSIANQPITAKDFRTWWGSVAALDVLADVLAEPGAAEMSPTARKRAIVAAVRHASELLGNTMAVCRRSYIHPQILESFQAGTLAGELKRTRRAANRPHPELQTSECRLAAWLRSISRRTGSHLLNGDGEATFRPNHPR